MTSLLVSSREPEGDDDPQRARLVQEALAMAKLSHPNVAAVYGLEVEEVASSVARAPSFGLHGCRMMGGR